MNRERFANVSEQRMSGVSQIMIFLYCVYRSCWLYLIAGGEIYFAWFETRGGFVLRGW